MATLLNVSGSGRTVADTTGRVVSNQIVFIDPAVANYTALLDGIAAGTEVYLLDSQEDGLTQIAQVMQDQTGISAISIIAHGDEGAIKIGSTIVDATTVSQSQAALATIGAALAPGGDILLYGCDTGEGTDGQALVDQIASETGANVAAASHLVGDVAAGDSWNLDVTSTGAPITAAQVLSTAALDGFASPLVLNGPPAGLPITVTSFTGNTSFVEKGNTTINSSGYLQLTSAATNQSGIAIYSQAFPSTTGISVQFTYYSGGGTGADGISFFLLNADAITAAGGTASSVVAGAYGGGLGYSDDGQAGITNGFLGLGFDTYGNYTAVDRGQTGTGAIANDVGVRGSGTGTTGYALLTHSAYAPGIDGTRTVKINLIKVDSTHESLSVFMSADGGTTYTEVITNYIVNQALPTNFYMGFAGSTGGSTDIHEIENLSVTLPVNLSVSAPTFSLPTGYANTYTLTPGQAFTYSYTITDSGPNGSSQITLADNAASTETGVTWTVKDDLQTQSGTGNINLSNINLASGDSATVTVSGTISATASTGNASHSITTTPGTAFSYQTPSTGIVEMAIGSANPQLTGTTATASTAGTTALQLFSAAQVADAHTSPTLTATITLTNSSGVVGDANGTLSGTGLTETSTKGIYTLSASGTATFNSDLESVFFTPTSATKVVTTKVGLSISNGISGTTAATATTTVTATCFLAGTRILTERGEITVDELFSRHGKPDQQDRVAVLEAGEIVFRPMVWIGSRHLDARTVAATDQYPVRIARDAFAAGVPHRDLLVTSEHCVFVDGHLVPARMLVNDRTIIEDRTVTSYSYYHVELEQHGILVSEGLTTESYLDTGNRGSFANSAVVALRPDLSAAAPSGRHAAACAPLAVERAAVEPIWRRLDARADLLGLAPRREQAEPELDPALHVLLDDGSTVQARWQDGGRHFFQLPRGRRATRLQSRSAVPARSIGAYVDDRRRLGIQIEAVVLWQGLDALVVDAEALGGSGWHGLENGVRWTDGEADLDLPPAQDEDSFLELVVTGSLAYPVELAGAEPERLRRAA